MAFPTRGFSKSPASKNNTCKIDEGKLNQMIKERAYYIWESKGKPQGQDRAIWFQAEKEVLAKVKK
ncbi:MAG: DUF2934 domain-containing protein [Candidatus Omnitrophota bacterium]